MSFFSFSQSIRIAVLAIDFVALLYNLTVIFRRCQDAGRILFRKLTLPIGVGAYHGFTTAPPDFFGYFDIPRPAPKQPRSSVFPQTRIYRKICAQTRTTHWQSARGYGYTVPKRDRFMRLSCADTSIPQKRGDSFMKSSTLLYDYAVPRGGIKKIRCSKGFFCAKSPHSPAFPRERRTA